VGLTELSIKRVFYCPQKEKEMLATQNNQVTMSSLELVEFINTQRGDGEPELLHKNFLAKVLIVLGEEYSLIFSSTYKASNGKENPCYKFPKREACLMAMSYSYDLQAKVFDRMTELENNTPALPKTYKEALLALVEKVEQIELLESQAQINKPKALFADAVSDAETTILIGEMAKILKGNGVDIGQTRLFEKLRDDGYLISRKGSDWNMPTQKSMELGLFKIKETAIVHSDGHTTISKTTKVTGKGQVYLVGKFLQ
jgi:phage antirepressor YoqD-like protein